MKTEPADFRVDEALSFTPSGDGPHDFLRIEKTGCNTQWVAGRLAAHAGVRPRDVGYAGLKDRHATTTQWFSVPAPPAAATDWDAFDCEGVRLLERTRNRRKLRRGAIAHNHFCLRLGGVTASADALDARMRRIAAGGVPNYFGLQRFGRDGGNLALADALFRGERLDRRRREFALSAARAWIFNQVLSARVLAGNWSRILPGEVVVLDGRASIFAEDGDRDALDARAAALEIHPTGPLWGRGEPRARGDAGEIESRVAADQAGLAAGLENAGCEMARRSLRLVPRDLRWELDGDSCRLSFRLPAGEYATTLVGELFDID